ncbi:MAG: hypothetical protein ACLFQX_04300 [Candidatus Kapaibacterium sp.]
MFAKSYLLLFTFLGILTISCSDSSGPSDSEIYPAQLWPIEQGNYWYYTITYLSGKYVYKGWSGGEIKGSAGTEYYKLGNNLNSNIDLVGYCEGVFQLRKSHSGNPDWVYYSWPMKQSEVRQYTISGGSVSMEYCGIRYIDANWLDDNPRFKCYVFQVTWYDYKNAKLIDEYFFLFSAKIFSLSK